MNDDESAYLEQVLAEVGSQLLKKGVLARGARDELHAALAAYWDEHVSADEPQHLEAVSRQRQHSTLSHPPGICQDSCRWTR